MQQRMWQFIYILQTQSVFIILILKHHGRYTVRVRQIFLHTVYLSRMVARRRLETAIDEHSHFHMDGTIHDVFCNGVTRLLFRVWSSAKRTSVISEGKCFYMGLFFITSFVLLIKFIQHLLNFITVKLSMFEIISDRNLCVG